MAPEPTAWPKLILMVDLGWKVELGGGEHGCTMWKCTEAGLRPQKQHNVGIWCNNGVLGMELGMPRFGKAGPTESGAKKVAL